jgi:hypothetical protein
MRNFYCQFLAISLCLLIVAQFGFANPVYSEVKNPLKDRNKVENIPTKDKKEIGGKNDRPRKEDIPVNPVKPKKKNTVALPVVTSSDKEEIKTIPASLAQLPMKGIQLLPSNLSNQKNLGPDPFRFTVTSSKDSIAVGEEIELTVTVDWVDYGVNNGVRFLPEWYKYALKVVMPKGFLQTGGDYTDYCTKPVDANNPQAIFTIKGKFEYASGDAKFLVLRGFEGSNEDSEFIWKGERNVFFVTNMTITSKLKSAKVNDICDITIDQTKISNRIITVGVPTNSSYPNGKAFVDFGDGGGSTLVSGSYSHTYCSTGNYTISYYWGNCQKTASISIPTNSTIAKPPKPKPDFRDVLCTTTGTMTFCPIEGILSWYKGDEALTTKIINVNSCYSFLVTEGVYYGSIKVCGVESDFATWEFVTLKKPTSVTATPANISSGATSQLKASCVEGSIKWYNVATGGMSIYTGSPYTTSALTEDTDFYVSCESTWCKTERIKISVSVNQPNICLSLGFETTPVTTNTNCGLSTGEIAANAVGGTFPYQYKIGSGSYTNNTDGIFTNLSAGSYDVYVLDSKSCEKSVTVTVNSNGGPADPKDYAGGSNKGPGSINLTAKCEDGITETWYKVATGGTPEATTGQIFPTGIISATTDYYVSCKSSTCESGRKKVTATILPLDCDGNTPNTPSASNRSRNGEGTVTIYASCINSNTRWYNAAGVVQKTATNSNDDAFTTPSINVTSKYYASCVKTVGTSECESATVEVTATINPINDPCANTTPSRPTKTDGSREGAGIVTLTATCTNSKTEWYDASSGGNILKTATLSSDNSYSTGYLSATTIYYAACINNGCTSDRISVTASILEACASTRPNSPSTTGDSREGAGAVTVKATCTTAGSTAKWYATSTSTTVLWSGSEYSTNISQTTTFYASCRTNDCESSKVGATASITEISNPCEGNAPTTPNATAGSREGAGTVNIYAACPNNLTRWYAASSGGSPLKTATDGADDAFTTPSISVTTTFYAVCINNTGCESGRVGVPAVVSPPCSTKPLSPWVTNNSREGTGSISIYANCNTPNLLPGGAVNTNIFSRWYDNNNNLIKTNNYNNDGLTVGVSTTTTYYATCYNSVTKCESSIVGVTATVTPCATPTPSVTHKANCGPGTFNIYANCYNSTLKGRWYNSATSNDIIGNSDSNNDGFTVTKISASHQYFVSCYNPTNLCESPRVGVWAIILPTTLATSADVEVCEGSPINLQVSNTESFPSTAFNGAALVKVPTYEWNGPNSYLSNTQNPIITAATAAHNGTYTAKVSNAYTHPYINNGNGAKVCIATTTALVKIYQKPTTAPILTPPSVCRGISGIITASNCAAPNSVLWYNSLNSTVAVGNGLTFPVLIPDNQNSQSFYAACSSKPELQCNSVRTEKVVSPLPAPPAPTNAKANKTNACIGSSVTLSGSCPAGQTIQWFNAANAPMTVLTFNHSAAGVYKYYAGCQDNTTACKTQVANRKEITVTVAPFPAAPTATSASATTVFCGGTIPTFNGTCATGQTLRWFADLGGIVTTVPGIYEYNLACQDNLSQCTTIEANRVKITIEVKSSAPAPVISKLGKTGISTFNLYPKQSAFLEATGCPECSVEWYEKVGGIFQLIPYETAPFLSIQKATAGTYTYKAKYKKDNCTGDFSNELTVVVAPCPDLVIQQPSPSYVCQDQTIELKVSSTQKGDGTTYQWFSQIQMEDSGPLITAPTYSKRDNYFAPEGTYFVKSCLAEDGIYYGVSTPLEVKTLLVNAQIANLNGVLVEGATLSLLGSDTSPLTTGQSLSYRWTEPVVSGVTLTNTTLSIPSITASKQGVYVFTVNKTIGTKVCSSTTNIGIYVNAATCTIDFDADPTFSCENGRGKITVTAKNVTAGKTVYYRIDGGAWQISNVFSNLSDGQYTIEILERATSLEYADATACMGISGSKIVEVNCTNPPKTEGTFSCAGLKLDNNKTIVAGTTTTLTVSGYSADSYLVWSNGVTGTPTITVNPTETTTYSVTATQGGGTSFNAGSGLPLKKGSSVTSATNSVNAVTSCLNTVTVNVVAAGGPDDLPPLIPIPPCPKCNATITVTPAISGSTPANMVWRNLSYTYSNEIKDEITPIQASLVATPTINNNFWYALKTSITNINKYVSLKVNGCTDGVVSWKNPLTKNVIDGEEIYVRPKVTTTYEVTCVMPSKETCTQTQEVKVQNYIEDCSSTNFELNTPVVSGTGTAKITTLSATGCTGTGAVISWYKVFNSNIFLGGTPNTENSLKIGQGVSSITVPYEEVRYNAECFFPTNSASIQAKLCKKFVNVGGACENFVLTYTISKEYSTVDATGCTGGTISWYEGTTLRGTGSRNPGFTTSPTTKYTVKCSSTGCEKVVMVFRNLNLTKTIIDCRKVKLDISGILPNWNCETGIVWTKRNVYYNDIVLSSKTSSVIYDRDEDPTFAKYYLTAECNDQYAKFKITFPSGNKPSNISDLAFFDVVKGDMINDFNQLDRSKTIYKPDVNSSFDLSALGCYDDNKFYYDNPDGIRIDPTATGKVTWSIVGLDASKYTVYTSTLPEKNGRLIQFRNVDSDFTYTATCKYPDSRVCSVQKEIKINFCPGFTASASKNVIIRGESLSLSASNCAGVMTWKNITNKTVLKPVANSCGSIVITPSTNSTYKAFCQLPNRPEPCVSNDVIVEVLEQTQNNNPVECPNFSAGVLPCEFYNGTTIETLPDGTIIQTTKSCGICCQYPIVGFNPYDGRKIKKNVKAILYYNRCEDGEVSWFDITNTSPGRLLSDSELKFTTEKSRRFLAVCKQCNSTCSREVNVLVSDADTGCDKIKVVLSQGKNIARNPGDDEIIKKPGVNLEVQGCELQNNESIVWGISPNLYSTYSQNPKIFVGPGTNYKVSCISKYGETLCTITGKTPALDEEEDPNPFSGRIGVPDGTTTNSTTTATAGALACGDISKATTIQSYITFLLTNVLNGKTTMTLAEAKAFLQLVVQTLCNDATLKANGITIPCTLVIDDATAQKLIDKKYGEVAAILTASLGGNVPIVDYNKNIVPEYTAIYKALLTGLKMQLKESIEPYIAKLLKEINATTIIGKDANNAYSLDKVKVFISLLQTVIKDNSVLKSKAYQLTFTSEALATLAQMYIDGKYDELAKKLAELMTQQITADDDIKVIQPTYPDVIKAIIDQTKGFIAYNGKEYKTGDVLPIALASSVGAPSNTINLTAMFAPLKDVKTKLTWSNASATSDKTIATFNRSSTTSLTGKVVTVTNPFNNEVITINVVVIEVQNFAENGTNTGFDPNTKSPTSLNEKCYPSYNIDSNKDPIPWKGVFLGNTNLNSVKFITKPVGAEKFVTFKVDNTSTFTLTTFGTDILTIAASVSQNDGIINSELSGEKIPLPTLKIKSFGANTGKLRVIFVDEENDDVNDIKVNQGKANIVCIQKGANNILDSTPSGDDQKVNDEITTGLDGIRQTMLSGDDVIANGITKVGNGLPNAKGLSWGANKFRDTIEWDQNTTQGKNGTGKGKGDDILVIDPSTGEEYFDTGADGVCNTPANNQSISNKPLLPSNTNIVTELNNIYLQSGIDFTGFVTTEIQTVNYDLNRNGTLTSPLTGEAVTVIQKTLNIGINDIPSIPTLILVHDFDRTATQGGALAPNHNLMIIKTNVSTTDNSIYKTFVHEYGHAVYALEHPWEDTFGECQTGTKCYPNRSNFWCTGKPHFDANGNPLDSSGNPTTNPWTQPTSGYDKYNIMDYEDAPSGSTFYNNRKDFRKYQWDLINTK